MFVADMDAKILRDFKKNNSPRLFLLFWQKKPRLSLKITNEKSHQVSGGF
jgi:hypothetical protein